MTGQLSASKSSFVSEEEVLAIQEPPFTRTWRPISHSRLIKSFESEIKDYNLKVTNRKYSLARGSLITGEKCDGVKMFGVWDIRNGVKANEHIASIGFRNSINKTLSIGICAGRHVFNCDNLQMSGEFVEFKRHTADLTDEELDYLTHRSLSQVLKRIKSFNKWLDSLKKYELTPKDTKLTIYDAVQQGVLQTTKLNDVHELILGTTPPYPRNLFGFHGAVTETIRENSLFTQSEKNERLNQFVVDKISLN